MKLFTASATAIAAREQGKIAPTKGRSTKRPALSPITRRILAVNILALGFLFVGLFYLDEFRRGLLKAELATLRSQADLFAAALGEGATSGEIPGEEVLNGQVAQQLLRRLVEASGTRARLFADNGGLIADSLLLMGPGGTVQIEELPPPRRYAAPIEHLLDVYDWFVGRFLTGVSLPVYGERAVQMASDYEEVLHALNGEPAEAVWASPDGGMVLSVAVPVQRYKQVLGGLMLTKASRHIDEAVLEVRIEILKVFLVALGVTVLMSMYLASTIARPIRRLAVAAQRMRRDRQRLHKIPDFSSRRDEIGELAAALREMTEALWLRMDAIERFAADVAHEIKNPLSSLRSAVETAARINDPDQRRRLMAIIQDDVQRLDRLITDISDASRLDAELSRAVSAPVDIGEMLATLVAVTETNAREHEVHLGLDLAKGQSLTVNGLEGRLVQVFHNLIANAISFSPKGGTIALTARRVDSTVIAEVSDDGPGIPEGKEKEIFLRFYSQRPAGEKFGTHSGLGLSISKQIVDAHDGTISAENRYRPDGSVAGARFRVCLPAA